jgi:hypothetical protein
MNNNFTKGNLVKLNRIAIPLAVGIAVSIAIPALGGVIWKAMTARGSIPSNAVRGGTNSGSTLYVCQAIHDKEYTPGKLSSAKICYIPWGGREYAYREYRVLTGNNWKWLSEQNFKGTPSNRVWGGDENNGRDTLYVCRAVLNGEYTPGKYYPPNETCYVSWGNREYQYRENFDFLVAD